MSMLMDFFKLFVVFIAYTTKSRFSLMVVFILNVFLTTRFDLFPPVANEEGESSARPQASFARKSTCPLY